MKRPTLFALMLLPFGVASAHDMFLVVPDHDLAPRSEVSIALYNGTFDKSENTIDCDRMIDVSVVDPKGHATHPAENQWRTEGNDTILDLRTGDPGTYVVGVSTKARMIELSGADFNDYLRHDGVLDTLEERKRLGILDRAATERYSKHVKTVLQVGDTTSKTHAHRLGYPVEIVPLENPTKIGRGNTLEVLVLENGQPVAGQLVYASYAGFHVPRRERLPWRGR